MDLMYKQKSVWETLSAQDMESVNDLSKGYITFLDKGKTERECTKQIIEEAKAKGFKSLTEVVKKGSIKRGTKVYLNNKDKSVILMVIGEDMTDGMNIIGAHIDSPRLDIKQNPLYEEGEMAFLKTHYYGGVKKYQWPTIPLALHGVIYTKKTGKKVEICIGEEDDEPVFFINDLLIHLSKKQLQETMAEGITGEQLNVVVGHMKPSKCDKEADDKEKEKDKAKENVIKENVLKILNEKYGIIEEDFRVAELEVVPAGKAKSVGIDASMIAAHGHDDRICAYTTLKAILEVENPSVTMVAIFADKEEIGSVGNTGMQAYYFENMLADLLATRKEYRDIDVRHALARSKMLSADVSAAFDPAFPSVFEKMNAAYMGRGICINKYTGSGGKGGSNDANCEFLQEIRSLFDDNNIIWQTAELGMIDAGGGGTIAYILAKYGTEVVDCGVPVLSMHGPYELASKADLYMAYKAYKAFYNC